MSSRWERTAMAKSTKKREIKTVKKVAPAPVPVPVREAELAPDAKPIDISMYDKIKIAPSYIMECEAGVYHAESWLGLGWAILTHRLWHLWNDGSFKD